MADDGAARGGTMDLSLCLGSRILDLAADEPYSPSHPSQYDPYFPSLELDVQDPPLHARYSPSDIQILQEPHPRDSQAPYDPVSPPYVPVPSSPPYSPRPEPVIDLVSEDDGGSPSRRRSLRRRFRSSLPYDVDGVGFDPPPSPTPVRLLHDIMSSHRSLGTTPRKRKAGRERAVVGGSEKEEEEKSRKVANFDCNICLEMAREPVVTSCGHLFCWPCMYQWLHVHSEHKECPVCKGEVVEASITPIYGRGCAEGSVEKKNEDDVELGLKIPPRPRGNRLESFRQQLVPLSRRLGEGIASWRRRIDERMQFGGRIERHGEASLPGMFTPGHGRGLTRLRPRRVQREERSHGSGSSNAEIHLSENSVANQQSSDTNSPIQDGVDLWHRFSFYDLATDRLAALTADLSRVVGRFASNSGRHGASTSSANPQNPEPQPAWHPLPAPVPGDQPSASSTRPVIEGDVVVASASADPNRAGSSRSLRRRGRSSTAASLDVDGGGLHGQKRRRLN